VQIASDMNDATVCFHVKCIQLFWESLPYKALATMPKGIMGDIRWSLWTAPVCRCFIEAHGVSV